MANNAGGGVQLARGLGMRVSGSTVVNNGWTGILGSKTDGLVVSGNAISYNNVRRWSNTVEAGMKLTYVRDGVIFDNVFEHNAAHGIWCDQGCGASNPSQSWFVLTRNLVRYNDKKGIFYEISRHGVIASNLVHDNGESGIAVFGSRTVHVWNNTAVDNNQTTAHFQGNVALIDDSRCYAGDTLPGGKTCVASNGVVPLTAGNYDHCEPSSNGPLASTCNAENIQLRNNIVSGSASSRPLLVVKDTGGTAYGAARILAGNDFQAYYRTGTSSPGALIDWQANAGATTAYASLAAYRGAVAGRETNSVERSGGTSHPFFVDYAGKDFTQKTSSADVWGRGAPIPSEVLKAIDWPATAPAQPPARIGAIHWRGKPTSQPPPATPCGFSAPVYHVRNPSNGDHLFTLSSSEVTAAAALGYTDDRGVAFRAAPAPASGVVPVYRMVRPTNVSHFWTSSTTERQSALDRYGFTDEGIGYYAATSAGSCLAPVYRLVQSGTGHHTYTVDAAERSALVASGWTDEGVRFYATP